MVLQILGMVLMLIKWKLFGFLNFLLNCYNFVHLKCRLRSPPICNTPPPTHAAIYTIIARYKPHLMMPSSADNFLTVIRGLVDPQVVLKEHITLFNITQDEAIFIDAGGKDVFDSSHGAFVYNTQFSLATKVIRLPLRLFHELSSRIQVPAIPIVHLPNHGRCGSTLLTKLIEAVPGALSISETMPFADIALMVQKGEIDHETGKQMIFSALMYTLKHSIIRKSKLVFLKLQHLATFITDMMAEVYPRMKQVYMYRQPVPFVRSWEKILIGNGWKITDDMCSMLSASGCYPILKDAPQQDLARVKTMSSFQKIALLWLTTTFAYQELIRIGYVLKSVKYEDLLENPRRTLSKLFQYVGLDESSLPDIDAVMAEDSQKDSDFTSRHMDKEMLEASLVPLTDDLKEKVNEMCREYSVPLFWGDVRLEKCILD